MATNSAHKNGTDHAAATANVTSAAEPSTNSREGTDSMHGSPAQVTAKATDGAAEALVGVMPMSVRDIGFETDAPGLFVHYEPLREWPGVPKIDSTNPVEVSTFEKVFSDGTIERIVSIDAGPTELTYESVHLLIDFLQEAARSLVATDVAGSASDEAGAR